MIDKMKVLLSKYKKIVNKITQNLIMFLGYITIGMISITPIFYLVKNLPNHTIALAIISPFWVLSVYMLIASNGLDHEENNFLVNLAYFFGLMSITGIVGMTIIEILI